MAGTSPARAEPDRPADRWAAARLKSRLLRRFGEFASEALARGRQCSPARPDNTRLFNLAEIRPSLLKQPVLL